MDLTGALRLVADLSLMTGCNLEVDALAAAGFLAVTLDPLKNALGSTTLHEGINQLVYYVNMYIHLLPFIITFFGKML